MRCDCQELSAYCLYNFIDKEDRNWRVFFINTRMQTDLRIVRPANRDWACQTERCHTLSNKTSLQ